MAAPAFALLWAGQSAAAPLATALDAPGRGRACPAQPVAEARHAPARSEEGKRIIGKFDQDHRGGDAHCPANCFENRHLFRPVVVGAGR